MKCADCNKEIDNRRTRCKSCQGPHSKKAKSEADKARKLKYKLAKRGNNSFLMRGLV